MTKMEYAKGIAEKIGGEVTETEKNNGVVFTGIQRREEGTNISPVVYIDQYYEDAMSIDEAAAKVDEILKANAQSSIDVDFILNFENIEPKLKAKLVNTKTSAEVFRSAADVGFDDLIIVPYIDEVVNFGEGKGTIKVSNALLERWNKTADEIIDIALKNSASEVVIKSMREVFIEMGTPEIFLPSDSNRMIIISNTSKINGAISVLFATERLRELFPNGYMILPSSIHEVIAVPLNDDDMDGMVQEVNAGHVALEEQLGNKAYKFAA